MDFSPPGWVLHHNTDLWRGTAPINNSNHGIWPSGGSWLCQHLWEHYLYHGDQKFLAERAYPNLFDALPPFQIDGSPLTSQFSERMERL